MFYLVNSELWIINKNTKTYKKERICNNNGTVIYIILRLRACFSFQNMHVAYFFLVSLISLAFSK